MGIQFSRFMRKPIRCVSLGNAGEIVLSGGRHRERLFYNRKFNFSLELGIWRSRIILRLADLTPYYKGLDSPKRNLPFQKIQKKFYKRRFPFAKGPICYLVLTTNTALRVRFTGQVEFAHLFRFRKCA